MPDEKKKPEEEKDEQTEQKEKPAPESAEKTPSKTAENAPKSEEKAESETIPEEQEKPAQGGTDENTDTADDTAEKTDEENQKLREENLRLKTQLEAMKIGFSADVIDDVVVLAENMAKRDNMDIAQALKAVAKKYPDWKADSKSKQKGGFRVGADSPENNTANHNKEKPTAQKRWNRFN